MPSDYTSSSRLRHVSYSELSTYRQCPHKHHLAYIERWDRDEASPALTRGRMFHEMLAIHYKGIQAGAPLSDVANVVLGNLDQECQDEEMHELLSWMYLGYLEHYSNDRNWTVLEVEKTDEVWLLTEEGSHLQRIGHYRGGSVGRSSYRLKMIVDLLVKDEQGRVWLVDHKTNADFPSELGLDLDDQFSLYAWGLGQRGYNIHGVVYNCIRTRRNKTLMTPEERFKRIPMYRTPEQLINTAQDAYRTTRRMRSADFTERATDSDRCQWRCSYTEACLWGRKGGDEREFLTSSGFAPDSEHS